MAVKHTQHNKKDYIGNFSDEGNEIFSDIFPDLPPLPDFLDFAPASSGNTYYKYVTASLLVTLGGAGGDPSHYSKNWIACFQCVICFEKNLRSLSFCIHCGRFLSCFECIIHIDRCPIC